MSWRSVLVSSGLIATLLACTAYTAVADDDDDDGSSSGGSGQAGGSSGGAASGSTSGTASGGSGSTSGTVSSSSSSGGSTSGGVGSSSSSSSSGAPLSAFQQEILDRFNAERDAVSPAATPALQHLTWSYDDADACQTYVEGCGSGQRPSGMAAGSGSSPFTASTIVGFFSDDGASYTYSSNACADSNSNCAFYKLMVNAEATQVACATKACGGSNNLWACVFTPSNPPSGQPY